jgi:serine/threonine-protein kinase
MGPSRIETEPDGGLDPTESLYGAELGPGAMVGECVIERLHARGGFGAVYEATAAAGETVAVKVLHASVAESAAGLRRFEEEIRAIQQIEGPHVVRILAWGDLTDGRPYLVMEWLRGATLSETLQTEGRFELPAALAVMEELCAALAAAHAAGIVHRDIKGSNVMLVPDAARGRRVKLLDFGIAKREDRATKLTATGVRLGTPSHMAPEQIWGQPVCPATDVYALGVLLFQMLTGRLPFAGDAGDDVAALHLHAPPPWAGDLAAIPDAVSEVIHRSLAKRPSHRHATVDELIEDLRAAAADPARPSRPFRVREASAVGVVVACRAEPCAEALAAARARCEADGWMTTAAGSGALLAAALRPLREEGAATLRSRAHRLALALTRAAPGLSARVCEAPVRALLVRGKPQIVGGALLDEAATAPRA